MIIAAVPVKDLENAKQRLVSVLTPAERSELARAMLSDVLRALASAAPDLVWVVTREPAVAAIARALGAEPLTEAENRGHTAAVAFAQAEASSRGARVFLTVPGDVPRVTAGELKQLAAAAIPGKPVFVPSRSGLGTNGVALAPPDAKTLRFGEPSFENHLAAARRLGLTPRVLDLPGLGLDVDAPDDLATLLDEDTTTETGRLLRRWLTSGGEAGIRSRLASVPAPRPESTGPRR